MSTTSNNQSTTEFEAPDFFLKYLHIENFRLLKKIDLEFEPTLNVIIGRNNDGKSALIDVLRLLFNTGTYEEMDDFIRFSHKDPSRLEEEQSELDIIIEATFYGRNDSAAESIFAEIGTDEEATGAPSYGVYKLRTVASYVFDEDKLRYKYKSKIVSGGKGFAHTVNIKTLDYMKAIYLDALRDITRDYKRVGHEIERLLYAHGNSKKLKVIPKAVKDAVLSSISDATGENQHEKEARTKFTKYAAPYGYNVDEDFLKFAPTNLNDEMLRQLGAEFHYGVRGKGTAALGLGSNGMGINNLIYSSIVLSRNKEDDAISRFFLIEEPEAHLHPQLQGSFFSELNNIKKQQLFVTSHSPTITSKAGLEKIIVLRDDPGSNEGTKAVMLRKIQPVHRKYLHKFLDVTRSQFLFANSVIFVEGVTEGMLIQRFSEIMGEEYNLRANGVEIVVLDAKHGYGHFKDIIGQNGLDMRSARIGDDDRDPDALPTDIKELIKLCQKPRATPGKQAEIDGVGTFELELLVSALTTPNDTTTLEILWNAAYSARDANDTTAKRHANNFVDFDNPGLAYRKMKQSSNEDKSKNRYVTDESKWEGKARTNSQFISTKSDYAYNIHEALLDEDKAKKFVVPQYIQDAIKHVTKKESEESASNN